ncbi:hypothetical protein LC574_16450 [Nostoc sp. CHAB 5715]|nr:hypothetical protein [Nostoc sp. CHAB 5715]
MDSQHFPLRGGCHCGNLKLIFNSTQTPNQLAVRTCACSFCRKHGTRSTSDPNGNLQIQIMNPEQVIRYRFGMHTADFLICGCCGVYVAALMQPETQQSFATINVNALDCAHLVSQDSVTVDYDGETMQSRQERRLRAWTPVVSIEEQNSQS